MKRSIVLCLLIFGMAWQSRAQTQAQSQADAISKYFSQYADDDKFTSVYISNRMFTLFSKAVEDDKEDREIKQAISKLKGIRILSSDKLADGKKMYLEAARSLPLKGYEELMVVKSEGKELKFLIIEAGGKISELLMLSGGGKDFFLLSMIGDIDLKQISKLSRSMDVKGMEDLEKLDDKNKKEVVNSHLTIKPFNHSVTNSLSYFMKTILLLACLVLAPALTQAQSKALATFQRKYKGTEESFSLNVNGGVLRLLMWFDGNEEDRELKEFVKDVKHVKIMRIPQRQRGLGLAEFNQLKEEVRKEAFDELMTIRSDDGNVDILIKEKNDLISDVLLLIHDQDDFVVLSLRGKMDLSKVFRMCNSVHIKGI